MAETNNNRASTAGFGDQEEATLAETSSQSTTQRTPAPKNLPRPPKKLLTPPTQNTDSIESLDTEARRENEENDAKSVPRRVQANTSLPTLLRIGNGGKFDEYSNTTEGKFQSTGGFTVHAIGGQKELQQYYGVYDPQQLRELQLAFGVKRYTDKPPLMLALEKGCREDYMPTVLQALEERTMTLQGELERMRDTTQKGMRKAFLKVLEDLLTKIRELPEDNPCSPPEEPERPGRVAETAGAKGCPCLEDLDLLRDLVLLVVSLLGVASPEVKAQMDEIRLEDILKLLESGKSETATVRLREILQQLGELEAVAPAAVAGGEDSSLKESLTRIWQAMTQDDLPDDLTVDKVLTKLGELLESSKANLEGVNEELRRLNREIAAKEGEVEDLQRQLEAAKAAAAGTADLQRELAAARTTEAESQAQIAGLEARIAELVKSAETLTTTATAKNSKHVAELATLRGQLATAEVARNSATGTVTRLEGELAASRAETGAAVAERDAAQAEVARITALLAAKNDQISSLNNQINILNDQKAALEESMAAGKSNVQQQLNEKNTEIATIQNILDDCLREKGELEAKLAEKDAEIATLTTRAETAEKGSKNKNTAAAATAAQITELEGNLEALTTELEGLRANEAEKLAAIKAKEDELSQKAAELAGIQPGLEAQIAALKASLAAAEKRATNSEYEVTELRRKLKGAQDGLAKANADHEKERVELATKQTELGTKLAALEEKLRAAEQAVGESTSVTGNQKAALEALQAEKETLLAEKAALEAKGPEAAAALAAAKAEFEAQIKECQEALEKLRGEKNTELAAAEQRHKDELAARNANIARLQGELATAKGETTAAEAKATGNIAAAQRAANEKVQAAEKKATNAAAAAETQKASNATKLQELERQLEAEREAKRACEEKLAELKAKVETQDTELAEIRASLPVPGEIEAQAATKAAEMQKNAAEKAATQGQISQLESKVQELESLLATSVTNSPGEETATRLNTLLGVILVDDKLKEDAIKYMGSGSETNLEPLRAKKTDLGIVSDELCEFFTYLYGVVRLQNKSLLTKFYDTKVPEPIPSDIFAAYDAGLGHTINNKDYLKEFSIFLQHFFGNFDERKGIPGQGLLIEGQYPELYHFITTRTLKEATRAKIVALLPTFGLISNLYILPNGGDTLTVSNIAPKGDAKGLNFAVFAVKYIQTVYEFIREKSESLLEKCKASVAAAAEESEQKGGADDVIEFEEFNF